MFDQTESELYDNFLTDDCVLQLMYIYIFNSMYFMYFDLDVEGGSLRNLTKGCADKLLYMHVCKYI